MMKNYLLSIFLITAITCQFFAQNNVDQKVMKALYINVGQGDATLLEFPCGAILIDTGAQDEKLTDNLIDYLEVFLKKKGTF